MEINVEFNKILLKLYRYRLYLYFERTNIKKGDSYL